MIRSGLRVVAATILIAASCWNIWTFNRKAAGLASRSVDDLVVKDNQFRGVRNALLEIGYRDGAIAFVTNHDLTATPRTLEDDIEWYQTQYAMVPWVIVRDQRMLSGVVVSTDIAYVIGDFREGQPGNIPDNLQKVYDSGDGVVLFRKRQAP